MDHIKETDEINEVGEVTLIIYGSLAPGEKNHHIISHIEGNWQKATIRGQIIDNGWSVDRSGYPQFKIVEDEQKADLIDVMAFTSNQLERHWKSLDEFEASEDYKRITIPCILENGQHRIAYIYLG